jgi:hypothetical protein
VNLCPGQHLPDAFLDSKIFLPTLLFDFLEGFLSVAKSGRKGDGQRALELQGHGRFDSGSVCHPSGVIGSGVVGY